METEDGGGLKGGGETMDGVETVTVGAAETEATQAETAAETTETLLAAQANQTAETGGETQQQQQQSISYAATAKTKSGDKRKEVEDRTYSLEFASFLKVENFTAQFNEIFYPTANMSTRPVLQSVVRDIANRRLTHITFSTQAMHDKHTSEAYQVKGEDGRLFWIPAKLKGYQITIQKIPPLRALSYSISDSCSLPKSLQRRVLYWSKTHIGQGETCLWVWSNRRRGEWNPQSHQNRVCSQHTSLDLYG